MKTDISIVYPHAQWDGCLSVLCFDDTAVKRLMEIEQSKKLQKYRVRASLSDVIPQSGDIQELLADSVFERMRFEDDEHLYYLHSGGFNAVYYRFVSDGTLEHRLKFVEVVVETNEPRHAVALGRTAINRLLDTLASAWRIAATITKLQILTTDSDEVLVTELLLPHITQQTLPINIAGIHESPLFTPWLSTLREALTSSSPYWRFLCAWRSYDGISVLRQHIRAECKRLHVSAQIPKDVEVNEAEITQIIETDLIKGVKRAGDLFARFNDMRHGVAHFLLKSGKHVDFSDGRLYLEYSIASAILLKVATESVRKLHDFYQENVERVTKIGSILPERKHAHLFYVRHPGISKPLSEDDFTS